MPFTFAHPIFAAPLKRLAPGRLRATGLALGSMAPDFEYFAAFETHKTIGHSHAGFLLMHLPVCAALALVCHRLLLPTLPLLLPAAGGLDRFAAERAEPRPLRSIGDWAQFAISLYIGFLTHLFTDGWTHGHTFATNRYDWLHAHTPFGFVVYEMLQFVLSAAGLGFMFVCLWVRLRVWRRSVPVSEAVGRGRKLRFRITAAVVAAVVYAVKSLSDADMSFTDLAAVAPFSALAAGWLAAALAERAGIPAAAAAAAAAAAVLAGFAAAAHWLQAGGYVTFGLSGYTDYARAYTLLWIVALWALSLIGFAAARLTGGGPDKRAGRGAAQDAVRGAG